MRRSTQGELARDPVGKYVAGTTFIHFCAAPDLWGVILWGRPDRAAAYELGRSLVLELGPSAVPHATVFDASRLTLSDPLAFRAAERYLVTFAEPLSRAVWRLALVRPSGVNGAVIAGAFEILPQPFPVTVTGDADEAFAWMAEGRKTDEPWPASGADFIDELYREVTETPSDLLRLREYLDAHLDTTRLDAAARALGVSSRSLQRHLSSGETTFTEELAAARIRAASRLLIESEASLTEIALDVGCSSLQQFSALFRRRVGEPPSAFRARHR